MAEPFLPFDVLGEVAQELHTSKNGLETLKSLSQCCHALHLLCQQWIFHAVHLGEEYSKSEEQSQKRIQQFSDILKCEPHIAHHVRMLSLNVETYTSRGIIDDLSAIMEQLDSIEEFELTSRDSLDWQSVHQLYPEFGSGFINLLQREQIRQFSLERIGNFPVMTFAKCAGIVDVKDYRPEWLLITIIQRSDSPAEEPLPTPVRNYVMSHRTQKPSSQRARNFQIYPHSVTSCIVQFDFSTLQTLDVKWKKREDVDETEKILKTADSITQFSCQGLSSLGFQGLSRILLAGPISTLTRLHLTVHVSDETLTPANSQLYGLCEELVALAESNILEEIDIHIAVYSKQMRLTQALANLDRSISRPSFPSLKRVRVKLDLPHDPFRAKGKHSHEDYHRRFLMGLQSMTDVNFSFSAEFSANPVHLTLI